MDAALRMAAREASADPLNQAPLGFNVVNVAAAAEGASVVYITSDPQWGRIKLQIRNNTDASVTIDKSSSMHLYVAPLVSPDIVPSITSPSSSWTAAPSPAPVHLEIGRTDTIDLAVGATIEIELDGVLGGGSVSSGYFTLDYASFGTLSGELRASVMRRHPPDPGKVSTTLTPGLGPRSDDYGDSKQAVYVTPWAQTPTSPSIANTFVLQISSDDDYALDQDACFVIAFMSGETDGSLCTDAELGKMIVGVDQNPDPTSQWNASKDPLAPFPVFYATPTNGTKIFSRNGPLGIRFDNLVTTLPAEKSSRVLVQFTGLSGYNDSYGYVLLDKVDPVPHVRFFVLESEGHQAAPGGAVNYGPATLKWDVFAAESCLLVEQSALLGPVDSSPIQATVPRMSFTLQPQVGDEGFSNRVVAFTVNPPIVDWVKADPAIVAPGGNVTLSWSCRYGDHVKVTTTSGALMKDGAGLLDSCIVNPQDDMTYTITAFGANSRAKNVDVQMLPSFDWVRVDQTRVGPDSHVTLSWSCRHADHCDVRSSNGSVTLPNQAASSSHVCPIHFDDVTYTVKGVRAGVGEKEASASVMVVAD